MAEKKMTEMQVAFERRKQLEARYKKTRVLVIEDGAEARGLVRGIMRDAGVEKIDLVSSGQEGIDCMQAHAYDVVLCDYNLGKGKDGQQVLEEARFGKFLRASTIFIMITAETTVEMVMGALEYQPDSYLTKPYSKNDLMTRLNRIIETKIEYREIEVEFGRGDYPKTVELCDQNIASSNDRPMRACRIKGESLLNMEKYEDSKKLYSEILAEREVPWAKIGMGKAQYHLKEYADAAAIFRELIKEQPNIVEGYDWLTRVQIAQGESRDAQDTLEQAVARSPKAVLRQMELARVALSNRSYMVAEKAYRKSIKLASNSCYHTPMNYLQYVRTLLVKIDNSGTEQCRDAFREANTYLARLRKEFERNPEVNLRATLLEALVHYSNGNSDQCNTLVKSAIRLYNSMDAPVRLRLADEYVSSLVLTGQLGVCEDLINKMKKSPSSEKLAVRLLGRIKDGKRRLRSESLNQEAMTYYKKGQIMDAYGKFSEAASTVGASANVLLNAVRICVELAEREDLNKDEWRKECGAYLERLSELDRCDHRYETYLDYKERYLIL